MTLPSHAIATYTAKQTIPYQHLTIDCSLNELSTEPRPLGNSNVFNKNCQSPLTQRTKYKNSTYEKEKRKQFFNKIYGISDQYSRTVHKLRKNKELTLQEHQNKLLQFSSNLRKESILKLNKEFRKLRVETSIVHPLPPLNYHNLLEHSKLELLRNSRRKRISLQKSLMCKTLGNKTAYELEMEKDRVYFTKPKKENSNISRLYEILPEHIVRALEKHK
jgi:hypothetical protein